MANIEHEIGLINNFFRSYNIGAETGINHADIAGKSYAVFGLKLKPGARINKIESHLRELAEALSSYRGQPTPVRLRQLPLALEVPHPKPEPLLPNASLSLSEHCMSLGRSWAFQGGEQEEYADLRRVPHVLIAGTTGSGKSKLLSNMLWSLCKFTSPSDIRLLLIDPKNEDLVPFADLPHVEEMAVTQGDAADVMEKVYSEMHQRIKAGRDVTHARWVVVVEELAEAAKVDGLVQNMSSVLAMGRSKGINVIACTQKPLSKTVGSIAKANFSLRLVGRMLSHKDAEVAADQPGTGAQHLPGRGSFLRVDDQGVRRFQSYFLENTEEWLEPIRSKWFEQLSFVLPEGSRIGASEQ